MYSQVADLQKLGVDAHVACERTENLDQFSVANIHSLANESSIRRTWDLSVRGLRIRHHLDYMVAVGRAVNAKILHSHFGNIAWANLGVARKLDVRHVATFYGLDVSWLPTQHRVWRSRYRRLFDEADLILCEGSHMASSIVGLGCPREKIRIQHLGVDVGRIEFRPRQWASGEILRVLIAASFREKKGIPYAIEALGQVHRRSSVALTIIGDAGDDAESQVEKRRILAAIDRSGLSANTVLLGYQPHEILLREAYLHHIFLQPSITASNGDTEGGAPVSIIEMLATGMPVISTEHCDIPEVMGRGLHALLAKERDVTGLVNIIQDLMEAPARWSDIASVGRSRVNAEYDRLTQAKRLVGHYINLLK